MDKLATSMWLALRAIGFADVRYGTPASAVGFWRELRPRQPRNDDWGLNDPRRIEPLGFPRIRSGVSANLQERFDETAHPAAASW